MKRFLEWLKKVFKKNSLANETEDEYWDRQY
jgi:hypothetical protein